MQLIGYVKKDGTGDFTDLVTGITEMISSGNISIEPINDYILYVDDASYSGNFNILIPNSGTFHVEGNGTYFSPENTNNISGIVNNYSSYNMIWNNFIFLGDLTTNYLFNVSDTSVLEINNSTFLNINNGINFLNSKCYMSDINAIGVGSGIFLKGKEAIVKTSKISRFNIAITANITDVSNQSCLFFNNIGISCLIGDVTLNNSLIYSGEFGVVSNSGILNVYSSTLDNTIPLKLNKSLISVNGSILKGDDVAISGEMSEYSSIYDSCLYPTGWANNIYTPSSGNLIFNDPLFHNSSIGDYRLNFKSNTGSDCVDHKPLYNLDGYIDVECNYLRLYTSNDLYIDPTITLSFTYKRGSVIIMSDHEKEIEFAKTIRTKNIKGFDLSYFYNTTKYNIPVEASFDYLESHTGGIDKQPFDWDYIHIPTTKIGSNEWWLVGRSFIDIEKILTTELSELPGIALFTKIDKTKIKIFNKIDDRGVAYDKCGSYPGTSIVWILDGRNHLLKKHNAFSNETIVTYPILGPKCDRTHVRPSGIIFSSAENEKYKFIRTDDSSIVLTAENDLGDVQWIPNHLDSKIDIHGIVTFKDNLFISMTQYSESINYDEFKLSGGVGNIVMYSNNNLFHKYIINPNFNNFDDPTLFSTSKDNAYPTDMTIYEDGNICVLDYLNRNKIYKYKLAYDYAMVENSYDSETKVLLREEYNDVSL